MDAPTIVAFVITAGGLAYAAAFGSYLYRTRDRPYSDDPRVLKQADPEKKEPATCEAAGEACLLPLLAEIGDDARVFCPRCWTQYFKSVMGDRWVVSSIKTPRTPRRRRAARRWLAEHEALVAGRPTPTRTEG